MQYTEKQAFDLLDKLSALSKDVLGHRFVSSYALGSLAHGGFSPKISDVDFLIILSDPMNHSEDAAFIAEIKKRTEDSKLPLANRASVFWSSVGELQTPTGQGRMPALDKLDFLLNAKLLSGKDVRDSEMQHPKQFDLDVDSANFIVDVLFGDHFRPFVTNPSENILETRSAVSLIKTLLFPPRLLYTLETGEIGENRLSAEYYVSHYKNDAASWVEKAYRWRTRQLNFSKINPNELFTAINLLYTHMVEGYAKRMSQYGESGLVKNLIILKKRFLSTH